MHGVDAGAVTLDLLLDLPLLAGNGCGGELIVAHLLTGHLSKCLHDPYLHVISICLKLLQGHSFLEALLSKLGCLGSR